MKARRRWIYRKTGTPYWQYSFSLKGEPYSGSTKETDEFVAQEWVNTYRQRIKDGDLSKDPIKVKLSVLFDEFLRLKSKQPSVEGKKIRLNIVLAFYGSDYLAPSLTSAEVRRLAEYLEKNRKLNPATINLYMSNLRTCWELFKDDYRLPSNPVNKKGWEHYDDSVNARERFLEPWEREALHKHLSFDLYCIMVVCVLTGMRQGDIRNLLWEWVKLDGRFILLPGKKTKEKKKRKIPLHPDVVTILRSMPRRGPFVFCNEDGSKLSRHGWIRSQWLKTLKVTGITNLRFHDLRHEFATLGLNYGMNFRHMQKAMGHAPDSKQTDVYAHLYDKTLLTEIDKLPSQLKRRTELKPAPLLPIEMFGLN